MNLPNLYQNAVKPPCRLEGKPRSAHLFVEFANPGVFLDLPIDKLVRALFGRDPPHAGQHGVRYFEVPPDHDMQEPYSRAQGGCQIRVNPKRADRDSHPEHRRIRALCLVPREGGQQSASNRRVASRTVGSGPLFLKKSLLPNADARAMNTSNAFSAVVYRVRPPGRLEDTRATDGKGVRTLRTRAPVSSGLRPFQIPHGNKQGLFEPFHRGSNNQT